jgi:GNAT superfamily N-acetyltransferase
VNRAAIAIAPEHTMTTLSWPTLEQLWQRRAAWRIRRAHIGDRAAMQSFVEEGLGATTRRLRFHGAIKACSTRLASALVEGEAVWAAFDDSALIGEARFVRDEADPERAEMAIAVADRWQGRGLGAALLGTVLAQAQRAGVRRLLADVMCGNTRMQRFVQRHGFAPLLHWRGGDTQLYECQLAAPQDAWFGPLTALYRRLQR